MQQQTDYFRRGGRSGKRLHKELACIYAYTRMYGPIIVQEGWGVGWRGKKEDICNTLNSKVF